MSYWWINIVSALAASVISAGLGFVLIPFLKRINFGQTILEIGPSWHKSKQGTPIMGGFMFIVGTLFAAFLGYSLYKQNLLGRLDEHTSKSLYRMLACLGFALLNSAIGFADDYIKAVKKQNLGLRAKQKMLFQVILAAALLYVFHVLGDKSTEFNFVALSLDFGIFYYPVMVLFIIFVTNAVNLTDGVDGLCGSVTVITMLAMATISSIMQMPENSILSISIAGGCLGFLVWNLHPAKCFMGDTGSMFLGGAFTAIGLSTHNHLIIILVGIIYICEALSVVLQVISFKTTGKRIFKMSPIHHHFELCKWSEYKIGAVFSLITIVFSTLSVLASKV